MHRHAASALRITGRVAYLTFALFLGLVFWYLPSLLNLDGFRPQLTQILEETFHCKVLVGNVTGQLVPAPGLTIGHVVFLESSKSARVLASVTNVRFSLSARTLKERRLCVDTIRFNKPRFIAHTRPSSSDENHWVMLSLPKSGSSQNSAGIREWEIRNGSIEIWDETQKPASKWVADQFNGTFQVSPQTGTLAGKVARLGRNTVIDLHYDGKATFPLQARFNDVELGVLQPILHAPFIPLSGTADVLMKARFKPSVDVEAQFSQPLGAGEVSFSLQSGARGSWRWSAEGRHFHLTETSFEIPEWSAHGDMQSIAVYARAATTEGGMAEIGWSRSDANKKDSTLEVDVSSVTIHQLIGFFQPKAKRSAEPPRTYERWRISRGSMEAAIHEGVLEVKDSDIDLEQMHLDLTGHFDLGGDHPQASVQGDLQHIPMAAFVETFTPPPSSVTGSGRTTFTLTFPLSRNWVSGLNGLVQVQIDKGVLRALKTIYRVMSVLNLGNYLRLRLPQVTAEGIEFENIAAHFTLRNGVLSTEDLFLKSPNMNVGVKGSVDLPQKHVDATLRLEMFRFLEDILKDVPITHWIFKKPNKIFLPLVVSLSGPWDNPDVR